MHTVVQLWVKCNVDKWHEYLDTHIYTQVIHVLINIIIMIIFFNKILIIHFNLEERWKTRFCDHAPWKANKINLFIIIFQNFASQSWPKSYMYGIWNFYYIYLYLIVYITLNKTVCCLLFVSIIELWNK